MIDLRRMAIGQEGGLAPNIALLGSSAQCVLSRAATQFSTRDPDEASARMCDVYSRHRLRILGSGTKFRTRLQLGRVGALTLTTLSFGSEIELAPERHKDFLLVTTQLTGRSEIASGAQRFDGGTGLVAVDSADSEIVKRFSADSVRMHVRIEQTVIEALCAQLLGRSLNRPLTFQPSIDAGGAAYGHWLDAMRLLLGYIASPPAPFAGELFVRRLEEMVMLMLLLEHRHNYSDLLHQRQPALAPRHVKVAEEYMRSHVGESLTLAAIAQAAGVSIRALNHGFRTYRHTTPMHYLRDVRLEAARRDLQHAAAPVTVACVASRWGFGNLGKFAADYRCRFGELPSDTLRRAVG